MEQNGVDNEVSFLDLLVAIETSNKHLSLLLSVCDRDHLRNSLTERYEKELSSERIKSYRVKIDRQEPSLFAAINQLVESEPYLQAGNPAVITVEGVASLSSFASEGERSPVDKFLGYLQWTREGMRQFDFPIVIWVTEHIHNEISRKAQDFYSWRQGVFFFESIQEETIEPIDMEPIDLPDPESDDLDLPIDELLVYIAQRKAAGQEDASLATFYTLLARAYRRDNQIAQAISTWQKAIALQEKLNLSLELAHSLNELGFLYYYQGKYNKAEPLYLRSLEIRERELGVDHPNVAISLNNLAELYQSQGKYGEAETLYLRSLEIMERELGLEHPNVATSLNNLAYLYKSQGKCSEAEHLYRRSLEIRERKLGAEHPAVAISLNNLAGLYDSQGKYSKAEPLYARSLAIFVKTLGQDHPNTQTVTSSLTLLKLQILTGFDPATLE